MAATADEEAVNAKHRLTIGPPLYEGAGDCCERAKRPKTYGDDIVRRIALIEGTIKVDRTSDCVRWQQQALQIAGAYRMEQSQAQAQLIDRAGQQA